MGIKDIINLGYTAADILDVYTKGNSKASKKVRKALSFGYPAATIVQHLFGSPKDDSDSYLTEEQRSKKSTENTYKKAERNAGLGAAALAGGIGLLARGAGAAGTLAQGANAASQAGAIANNAQLPPTNPPGGSGPGPGPLSVQGIQQQAAQLGRNKPNQPSPIQVPGQQNFTFDNQEAAPEIDFFQTKLAKENPSGLINFIENHQQAGKTPEETYEIMKNTRIHGPRVKQFEEESGIPFSEAIKQVYSRNELDVPEHISEEIEPIIKGSKVITPDGQIGDVFHQKNDTSIIESDGKRSKSKTDDLIPMPKAWEHIHVDLSKVPEQDRSSNIQQVAATENGKEIVMTFWERGDKPKMYIYERKDGQPFDPEILNTISEESDIAVTNGLSFYGGWSTSDPSRGSAFHHRLKMLSQADNEPDDPNKPFIFKRAPVAFKHGYLVAVQQEYNRAERDFNAEFKPPKKRKK